MNKPQALFFALALSLGCSLFVTQPANAVEETVNEAITVTGDEDPSTGTAEVYSEEETITTTAEPDATSTQDCDDTTDEKCQTEAERYDTELENALEEGLANEPEVICATGDEEGCEDAKTEPALWPLYLSLGAIAVTIVVIIVLNLIGRKKR